MGLDTEKPIFGSADSGDSIGVKEAAEAGPRLWARLRRKDTYPQVKR